MTERVLGFARKKVYKVNDYRNYVFGSQKEFQTTDFAISKSRLILTKIAISDVLTVTCVSLIF